MVTSERSIARKRKKRAEARARARIGKSAGCQFYCARCGSSEIRMLNNSEPESHRAVASATVKDDRNNYPPPGHYGIDLQKISDGFAKIKAEMEAATPERRKEMAMARLIDAGLLDENGEPAYPYYDTRK